MKCPYCTAPITLTDIAAKESLIYHASCLQMIADDPETQKVFDPRTGKEIKARTTKLNSEQKTNVAFLAQQFTILNDGVQLNSSALWEMWPRNGMQAKVAGPVPDKDEIQFYITTPEFMGAMERRGISPNVETLTPEQMALLQLLTDTGRGTLESKLNRAKVKQSVFRNWMRQPKFREAYSKLSGSVLKDAIPAARVALADKAANGDINAIKYMNELTGEYRPHQQEQNMNGQEMVRVVLAAIQSHVKDPEVLMAIQRDIRFQAEAINSTAMIGAR